MTDRPRCAFGCEHTKSSHREGDACSHRQPYCVECQRHPDAPGSIKDWAHAFTVEALKRYVSLCRCLPSANTIGSRQSWPDCACSATIARAALAANKRKEGA